MTANETIQDTGSETLLVFGAPDRSAVEAHLADHSGRAILVEPDPGLAADLAAAFEKRPEIRVIAGHLAAQDGEATLSVYNHPGLRGLRAPTDHLRTLFPGLRVLHRQPVQGLTAEHLLAQIGPLQEPVHLWLEAPGEEAGILDALRDTGALAAVMRITLHCGREAFFEAASSARTLTAGLVQDGFFVSAEDSSDPDWPVLDVRRLPLFGALREAETRIEALEAERDQARQQGKAQAKALQEQIDARDTQVAALEAALEAAQGEAQALALQEQIDARDTRIDALEAELEAARGDLAMALRLQTLAQSDTRALRTQFQKAEAVRLKQAALLEKLMPRLQQAAAQLHELVQEGDPAPEQLLEETAAAKTAPAARKPAAQTQRKTKAKQGAAPSSRRGSQDGADG